MDRALTRSTLLELGGDAQVPTMQELITLMEKHLTYIFDFANAQLKVQVNKNVLLPISGEFTVPSTNASQNIQAHLRKVLEDHIKDKLLSKNIVPVRHPLTCPVAPKTLFYDYHVPENVVRTCALKANPSCIFVGMGGCAPIVLRGLEKMTFVHLPSQAEGDITIPIFEEVIRIGYDSVEVDFFTYNMYDITRIGICDFLVACNLLNVTKKVQVYDTLCASMPGKPLNLQIQYDRAWKATIRSVPSYF
jgi:hypothetical protein